MDLFKFPNKQLRAEVIREYMKENGIKRAVCFSCGNASRELKLAGVDVVDVSPGGDLTPGRWFAPAEIARTFPGHLDATSGHLSIEIMNRLARRYKEFLGTIPAEIFLPTGSGETLLALKMAYPAAAIHAVYDLDSATQYEENAPLNDLVKALAASVIREKEREGGGARWQEQDGQK